MNNRDEIIQKYLKLFFENSNVFNKKTINRISELNDYCFDIFNQFHNYYYELALEQYSEGKHDYIKSYHSRRSCVLPFIEYCNKKNIVLDKISQDEIESFFLSRNFGSKQTLSNYISHISSFLDFFKVKFERKVLKDLGDYINKKARNKKPLSSKEIENIRGYCKENDLYFYLYIFEALYTLKIHKDRLPLYKYEVYDSENMKFIFGEHELQVDSYIHSIIEKLKNNKQFNSLKNYDNYISYMEMDFIDNGLIEKYFRFKDVQLTYGERTYNTCPECGNRYENIAENWVVKQYQNSDTKWIVCKAVCGKVDEN